MRWEFGQELSRGISPQQGDKACAILLAGLRKRLSPIGGVELGQGASGFFPLPASRSLRICSFARSTRLSSMVRLPGRNDAFRGWVASSPTRSAEQARRSVALACSVKAVNDPLMRVASAT